MPSQPTRTYLLAALLGASHLGFGQTTPPRALYPTAARSDAWMDSVRRLPLSAQVAAIRARVLADTVLRHRPDFVCLMPLTAAQREAYGRAQRPRLQAEAARPAGPLRLFMVDNNILTANYSAQTIAFLQQLDARHIRRIRYYPAGTAATALYGTRGAEGVVLLSSNE